MFHCQITTVRNDIPSLILQRRSQLKAAFPGLLISALQVTLAAGELPADGVRELEEELEVVADPNDLVLLGERRLVDDSGEGQLNKELTSGMSSETIGLSMNMFFKPARSTQCLRRPCRASPILLGN